MEFLFQTTLVDGTTATIPCLSEFEEPAREDEEENEDIATPPRSLIYSSPSISNSRKRGSSTTDTSTSPNKFHGNKKVPVSVIMQGLVTQLEIATDKEAEALKQIAQTKKGEADQAKQAKNKDV
jgi:hypothetical protein